VNAYVRPRRTFSVVEGDREVPGPADTVNTRIPVDTERLKLLPGTRLATVLLSRRRLTTIFLPRLGSLETIRRPVDRAAAVPIETAYMRARIRTNLHVETYFDFMAHVTLGTGFGQCGVDRRHLTKCLRLTSVSKSFPAEITKGFPASRRAHRLTVSVMLLLSESSAWSLGMYGFVLILLLLAVPACSRLIPVPDKKPKIPSLGCHRAPPICICSFCSFCAFTMYRRRASSVYSAILLRLKSYG
jgi:hypothetical protein